MKAEESYINEQMAFMRLAFPNNEGDDKAMRNGGRGIGKSTLLGLVSLNLDS